MKKLLLAALAIASVVVVGGTIAWAAAGGDATVNACVGDMTRIVRIPAANTACAKNETPVSWSVQGPIGPAGPKGDTGPQGPAGAAAGEPHSASFAYMKIEGTKQGVFKGSSTDPGRSDWTPVLGFSYGVVSPRDAGSGQATGKRQHKPIRITKEWNASTPQLFQALVTNEVLKSVTIEFTDTAGSVVSRITLTNASASDDEQSNDGKKGQATLEEVAFTFQKITVESVTGKTMAMDDWESPVA